MRVSQGKYHPKPAYIYRMVTTYAENSREPIQTPEIFLRTFIRIPRNWQMTMEMPVQNQQTSQNQCVIAMRLNSKTLQINPSMEIHHRGRVYGILGPVPMTEDLDELEFVCQFKEQSSIYP